MHDFDTQCVYDRCYCSELVEIGSLNLWGIYIYLGAPHSQNIQRKIRIGIIYFGIPNFVIFYYVGYRKAWGLIVHATL